MVSGSDEPTALLARFERTDLAGLMAQAEAMTLAGHGARVTYSRKVFIPLTKLCRDVCHYCTFATTPAHVATAYLSRDEVLEIARAGAAMGCREALFTLGDQPERRYAAAREALAALGHETTLSYLAEMAQAVLDETGLLPHLNPGLMDAADYAALRPHAASMGIMLESSAERLCVKGGPHHGSPDKVPTLRLAAIEAAGVARVPFTTGLLIGIGETRLERIEALIAIRDLHRRHGHIQEVIVQNFRAKPGTRMADRAEPSLDEHLWTIAAARLILGAEMTIQAPPNLHAPGELGALLRAGVNDWGGVSPVTPDHVNPEAPWPHLDTLDRATAAAGRTSEAASRDRAALRAGGDQWADASDRPRWCCDRSMARGYPSDGDDWSAGHGEPLPALRSAVPAAALGAIVARAEAGDRLCRNRDRAPVRGRGRGLRCGRRARRPAATGGDRRHGDLCGQPQHQLHQYLPLQMRLLRLFQGQHQGAARPGLSDRLGRDRPPRRRGGRARRHRGLPAGRHPPRL